MTRRVQFARSVVTGNIPASLQTGTPAFNLKDGKIYVGNVGEQAQLISQRITDFSLTTLYRAGDFVIYQDDLYRAKVDISANSGWDVSKWTRLTTAGGIPSQLETDTGLISGGDLGIANSTQLQVSAGSGIIVDRNDPEQVNVTVVEWASFKANAVNQLTAEGLERATFRVYIDSSGVGIVTSGMADLSSRAQNILLGEGFWDVDVETLSDVFNIKNYAQLGPQMSTGLRMNGEFPYIRQGVIVTPNGLKLRSTAGRMIGFNVRMGTTIDGSYSVGVNAADPIVFDAVSRRKPASYKNLTDVPVSFYDNSGAIAMVPAGKAVIHMLKIRSDNTFFLELGQRLFDSSSQARQNLFYYERGNDNATGGHQNVLGSPSARVIAAIIVTPETTDLNGRVIPAQRSGEPFTPVSDDDLSLYYRLDGQDPLAGDMNAAGFKLLNADIDGDGGALLRPEDFATTGDGPSGATARTLATNVGDRKLFSGDTVIADRVMSHDPLKAYKEGDSVYKDNSLYTCIADIAPKAWNPADWQLIGSSALGNTGALIKLPDAPQRNEVDLTGNPGVSGLEITPDASQAAPVASFGKAIIDQYGVPGGTFGNQTFRVNQSTHGFTNVGTAIAFDEPNWIAADPTDPALTGKVLAVVREVVDANNFDAQLTGLVPNLSVTAFEGGSRTPGAVYYASSVTPGKLTENVPASPNRVDPVLVLLTATTGLLAIASGGAVETQGGGQTFFEVAQTNHGFTNVGTPVYFDGADWQPAQANDLGTTGIGLIQQIIDINTFVVNVAGYIENLSASAFEGAVAPTAGTFYYVSQTDPGELTATEPAQLEDRNKILLALSPTTGVVMNYEMEEPTVGRRGEQFIEGPVRVNEDITWGGAAGDQHRLTDNDGGGNANIRFGHFYDGTNGLINPEEPTQVGGSGVQIKAQVDSTSPGQLQIKLFDDGTINGDGSLSEVARLDFDHVDEDDLPSDYSIVSRIRGDARYLQLIGGTISGDLTVDGNGFYGGGGVTIEGGAPSIFLKDTADGDSLRIYGKTGDIAFAQTENDTTWVADIARIDRDGGLGSDISLVSRAAGDSRYRRRDEPNVDDLTIANNVPTIFLYDANRDPDIRQWRLTSNTGTFYIAPTNDAGVALTGQLIMDTDVSGNVDDIRVEYGDATTLPDANSIVSRGRGDARYLMLDGTNGLTAPIQFSNFEPVGLFADGQLAFDSSRGLIVYRDNLSSVTAEGVYTVLDTGQIRAGSGISISNLAVDLSGSELPTWSINRTWVDTVYMQRDADTDTTGTITASTTNGGIEIGHGGANAYIDNTGTGDIEFRFNGLRENWLQPDGELFLSGGLSVMHGSGASDYGLMITNTASVNGSYSMLRSRTSGELLISTAPAGVLEESARVDPRGSAPAVNSVIIRESGDVRYVRLNVPNTWVSQQTFTEETFVEDILNVERLVVGNNAVGTEEDITLDANANIGTDIDLNLMAGRTSNTANVRIYDYQNSGLTGVDNAVEVYRFDNATQNLPTAVSVVNRAKGDGRYVLKAGATGRAIFSDADPFGAVGAEVEIAAITFTADKDSAYVVLQSDVSWGSGNATVLIRFDMGLDSSLTWQHGGSSNMGYYTLGFADQWLFTGLTPGQEYTISAKASGSGTSARTIGQRSLIVT